MSDKQFLKRNGIAVLPPSSDGLLIIHDASRLTAYSALTPVLDVVGSLANCAAVRLYWMDPAAYELQLVSASPALEDSRIPRMSLHFPIAGRHWLEALAAPEVLVRGDAHFTCFPETVGADLQALLIHPLRGERKLSGILTLARTDSQPFGPADLQTVAKLSGALVAAMKDRQRERELEFLKGRLRAACHENNLLERRLLERKQIERAKGLLQGENGWTEEEAYYHIRRTSRQQRIPMAVIAQRIIDVAVAKEAERAGISSDGCAA